MEYASTVWNPIDPATLILKLEMVQQKSICWICCNCKKYVSVTKLRQPLGMKTLETRHSVAQLNMFHELIDSKSRFGKTTFLLASNSLILNLHHCLASLNHILHLYFHKYKDYRPAYQKTLQIFKI